MPRGSEWTNRRWGDVHRTSLYQLEASILQRSALRKPQTRPEALGKNPERDRDEGLDSLRWVERYRRPGRSSRWHVTFCNRGLFSRCDPTFQLGGFDSTHRRPNETVKRHLLGNAGPRSPDGQSRGSRSERRVRVGPLPALRIRSSMAPSRVMRLQLGRRAFSAEGDAHPIRTTDDCRPGSARAA